MILYARVGLLLELVELRPNTSRSGQSMSRAPMTTTRITCSSIQYGGTEILCSHGIHSGGLLILRPRACIRVLRHALRLAALCKVLGGSLLHEQQLFLRAEVLVLDVIDGVG